MTNTESREPTLHERLRSAILSLELSPGQRVSERGLEPEFGGSRTPIRAAIMRLESEGLVKREGKTWIVAPIDLDEIGAMYEFREILESASSRLVSARASRADLEALADLAGSADAAQSAETPEHSIDTGTSFHSELARLSGNSLIIDAMDGVLTRLYRTRWLEVQSAESRERALREHRTIAAALLARDAEAADLATREHLHGISERLVESVTGNRQQLRANGIRVGNAGRPVAT